MCVDDASPTCGNAARTAGTIYAVATAITGIDLAERYPTSDTTLSAGEIVSFDPANQVFVQRANSPTNFLGVVSTAPGIDLGGYNEELYVNERKIPIALAGRVPVKFNMDGGPISVGDAITVSTSTPGIGRRATASGETIGIALENASAEGVVEVFIKPEYTWSVGDRDALAEVVAYPASASSTPAAGSFMDGFIKAILGQVGRWLADAGNGITDFFANRVHTKELCISDESGETCVSRAQLDAMLAGGATGGTTSDGGSMPPTPPPGGGTTTGSTSSTDTTAPVVSLNGSAAMNVEEGAAWSDPGASASDEIDGDLTGAIAVEGVVDTSTPGLYTLTYGATDAAGNTGSASRAVVVVVGDGGDLTPTLEPEPTPTPESEPTPEPEPALESPSDSSTPDAPVAADTPTP